jgi:hypothetical protein
MKSETQFLRKKQYDLHVFQTFVRCEINLGIGSVMRQVYISSTVPKIYSEQCLI